MHTLDFGDVPGLMGGGVQFLVNITDNTQSNLCQMSDSSGHDFGAA